MVHSAEANRQQAISDYDCRTYASPYIYGEEPPLVEWNR